jgi:hypothetical protein
MKQLIYLFLLFASSVVGASELVQTCDVGAKATTHVEVVRDSEAGDTYIYYLRQHGKMHPFFGSPDASRGSDVHVTCAGKKQRALIITGAFTANFLQGFVLMQSAGAGKIERLDFAEKSPPEWLYLGASKTMVVLPTHGYGETSKKYVVYRHVAGAKEDMEAVGMDRLPAADRFEVIKLEQWKASE